MNKLLLCFVLLVLISATFAGVFPRMDVSCPPGQTTGRFWDGQKCEVCSYRQCYCNAYLGCDSCQDSYSLALPSNYIKTCLPCASGLSLADGVKQCCFLEEGPDHIDPASPFQINNNGGLRTRPMRATQCFQPGDALNSNGYYYQMFGSVCYKQPGCLNFTDYGKCSLCQVGYFMNQNSQCQSCTYRVSNCAICLADFQCTTCQVGYYMATNDGKTTADNDVISSASICKKCNDYCTCSGLYDSKLQALRLCEGCISNNYWFKSDSSGVCTACSSSIPNCLTCSSDKKCLQCSPLFVMNNDGTACVSCPDFCYKCSYLADKQKATCASDGCYNGYFSETTTDNTNICVACTIQYVSRCTNKNGATITQCGDQLTDPTDTDPPHSTQKYLINTQSGQKCQPNSNNCKKMTDKPVAGQEGTCDTCYEDQGYFLLKRSKICVLCTTVRTNCDPNSCTANDQDTLDCTKCIDSVQPTSFSVQILNYYLTSSKNCAACPPGCLKCSDGSTCSNCQLSYLQQTTGCTKCSVNNCQDCSGGVNKCAKCFPGFKVYTNFNGNGDDLCITCDDPQCKDCTSDRKTCNACQEGYYVAGKVCVPRRTNCVQYRPSEGTCSVCQYGYRPVNGWCVSCFNAGQGYVNCQQVDAGCVELKKQRRDGDQYNVALDLKNYPPKNVAAFSLKTGLLIVISLILLFIM